MTYTRRRRLSLLLLLVWLPAYVMGAVWLMDQIPRLPLAAELLVYTVLGVAWALPFRAVFRGVGRDDPAAQPPGPGAGR